MTVNPIDRSGPRTQTYQSSGTNFWLRITVSHTWWLPWCSVLL